MRTPLRKYLFTLLVLCCALVSFSATVKRDTLKPVPLKIDPQAEQDIFSDKDYVYVEAETAKGKNLWAELRDALIRKIFGNLSAESVDSFWNGVTYVLAILFIVALVFIFVRMKGGRLFKGESAKTSVFTDIAENIDAIDIDQLIREAMNNQDYRLAFRYSFLKSLQLMNNKKFIDWKPHKTNYEYYNEFRVDKIKPLFKDLYTGFEYVWYGDSPINKEIYEKYNSEFNEFNGQLSA